MGLENSTNISMIGESALLEVVPSGSQINLDVKDQAVPQSPNTPNVTISARRLKQSRHSKSPMQQPEF